VAGVDAAALLVAVLGTDLGTKQGETDANKRDGARLAGRLNDVELEL
jgi:hypothetical protein